MSVKRKAKTREASQNMTIPVFAKLKFTQQRKNDIFTYFFLNCTLHNAKCFSLVTPVYSCTNWRTLAFNLWSSKVVSPVEGPAERSMTTTNFKELFVHSRVTLTTDKCCSISTNTDTIPYTMARRTHYRCAGATKIKIIN